jgi:hypothetical protein
MYALDPKPSILQPQPPRRRSARTVRPVAPAQRVPASPKAKVRATPRVARSAASSAVISQVTRETLVKLSVNSLLLLVAGTTLARLVPTYFVSQAQIQELNHEVAFTESRMNQLRQDFSKSFDPSQARVVMVEQTYKVDPQQRQVVWSDSEAIEVPRQ